MAIADRGSIFYLRFISNELAGPSSIRRLRRRGGDRDLVFADRAVEGGAPLRVVFAAEKPLEGELALITPNGSVAAKSRERRGGPPYFWFAEVAAPDAGTWRAKLESDRAPAGCSAVTHEIVVRAVERARPSATEGSLCPVRNTWNRATENLYSAWIEKRFDASLDTEPSWRGAA